MKQLFATDLADAVRTRSVSCAEDTACRGAAASTRTSSASGARGPSGRFALLPLEREALRALWTLLLQNETGHLPLAVELELDDGSPGVLETGL
jgi:hypothetical protein